MNSQQTVLRVLTNIPNNDITITGGTISIFSQTGITLSGTGVVDDPYTGSTGSGAQIVLDVNDTNGTFNYNITGVTGFSQSIYVTHNGVETIASTNTGLTANFIGTISVKVGDSIRIVLTGLVNVGALSFVPIITPVFKYEFLDLYSSVPIKINRSFAELQDIAKRNSDYSIGIQIPGSKKNNKFFEDFYNVDMQSLYFVSTNKVLCEVLINDESYFSGYMRLNKVSVLNSKVEYDVTLYSTVGNLFGDIGNNLLKDLDFSDEEYTFNHEFNLGTVTSVYGSTDFSNDKEAPSTYFYPIVHNGYLYTGNTVNLSGGTIIEQTRLYTSTADNSGNLNSYVSLNAAYAAGVKPYRINSPSTGVIDNQLKPALSIWNLIKLMFKTYGYSIKSDFMNTPWMKALYMYGYFSSNATKFSYTVQNIQSLPPSGVEFVKYFNSVTQLWSFILTKKGTGIPCYCSEDLLFEWYEVDYYDFEYRNATVYGGTSGTTFSSGYLYPDYVQTTPSIGQGYYLAYQPLKVGDSVPFIDGLKVDFGLVIDPLIKQIDLLSSIAKKFNLVFVTDPDVTNQIIIEPFNFYIGTGDVYDWSDKISFDKGFTVEPALNYVESNLTLTDLEDGDYGNQQFKDQNNRIYGQNNVYNPTDYKSQEKKIETIFSPEIIREWDTLYQTPNGGIKLPLGINYAGSTTTQQSGGSEVLNFIYTGVKTKPKLFFNLGSANLFIDTLGEVYDNTKYFRTYLINILRSDGTIPAPFLGFNNVPVVSHTIPIGLEDKFKINNDSLSILFNSELPINVGVDTFNVYTENDIYSIFYANRVNNLYDPNTRFLKGNFYLKLSDYNNLKPQDLIKINNQYFTWNKISNYNLTNVELTEVELVQANSNSLTYPTRYFKYWYCDDPSKIYKLKTDFTNPSMLDTNYGWSILYDHNLGTISQTTNNSGYTSMFIDNYSGYSPTEEYFVPYTTQEITENSYENAGYLDWTYDSMHNFIWAQPYAPYGSLMPTYWLSSGWTVTGLNVFSGCTSCLEAISTYNILTGSSINHGVIPTPTPTPTPSPTPTPLPLGPMRGSLLFTFNETPNYPGYSNYDVFVNGQRRVLSHYNNTNIYTTYIYSGDTVLITVSEQNNFNVVRRDYTTDDQGGDNGIRDTQITGTTGQYSITFVVDIIPQDYNFEYRVIGTTFGSRANIITQNYFDILTEDGKELITQQNI